MLTRKTIGTIIGEEVWADSRGVEGETPPVESWRPTSPEGHITSPAWSSHICLSAWECMEFSEVSSPRHLG